MILNCEGEAYFKHLIMQQDTLTRFGFSLLKKRAKFKRRWKKVKLVTSANLEQLK